MKHRHRHWCPMKYIGLRVFYASGSADIFASINSDAIVGIIGKTYRRDGRYISEMG